MESSSLTHDPARLLEHADWVRALARTLVSEASAAEDVAQETWLAALRTPPPGDRPVRAWLAAVARNAARQLGRADSRRVGRERAAARPEGLPSDRELQDRVELQRWVAELVLELDEPYRRVVLLRFFEGLPPREIAVQMGLPLETVKSRLRRALDRLRERLGAERGPSGERGLLALLPLVNSGNGSVALGAGALVMGTKSIVVALAALVLVLLGVLCLTLGGGESPPPIETEGGEVASVVPPDPIEPSTGEAEAEAVPTIDPVEERVVTTAETKLLRVAAVESGTGQPVAGAKVWIARRKPLRDLIFDDGRGESRDIEASITTLSRAYEVDEQGLVAIPPPGGYLIAVARAGELFGVAYGSSTQEETLKIELLRDRSLTIRTVDEQGQPVVGVPVGIAENDPDRSGRAGGNRLDWWARTAGKQGEVTLFHVDHTMKDELVVGKGWEVTLATPHPDPPTVPVDPFDLPTDVVSLVVAQGGRVVVHLEDATGEPVDTWVHLRVELRDRDEFGRYVRARRHDRHTKGGTAVFEPVVPGLQLHVEAASGNLRPVEEVHPGPAAIGEETIIRLRLAEPYPTFAGTLVDTTGEPVAHRQMDLRVFHESVDGGGRDETDGRFLARRLGRFEAVAPIPRATDLLHEVLVTTNEAYEGDTLEARILLDGRAHEGTIDLGEVILYPPSVILSGRVVDAAGEPIYWAGIWVRRLRDEGVSSGASYTWVHELQTQTDHDGRFQLTGELPPGEYRIDADQDGYLRQEYIPFQLGQRDLEVVLLREGGLKGSLILAEGISPVWLRVELLEHGAESARYGTWGSNLVVPRPDGDFFLPGLEPGTYDVEVVVPSWRTPLVRVEDVTIEGGIDGEDSRLMELDLRNRLFRIDVAVTGAGDDPVPRGYATYAPDGGEVTRMAFLDGAATLLASSRSIDVELHAPGYRPLRASGVIDGTRSSLERGLPVRLKLPADLESPEPPLRLWAEVAPRRWDGPEPNPGVYAIEGDRVDIWRGSQAGDRASFDDRGEATLHVGEPGSWSLRWWVGGADGEMVRNLGSERGYPRELEVGEGGSSEPIEVCPELEQLRSTLEELGG